MNGSQFASVFFFLLTFSPLLMLYFYLFKIAILQLKLFRACRYCLTYLPALSAPCSPFVLLSKTSSYTSIIISNKASP